MGDRRTVVIMSSAGDYPHQRSDRNPLGTHDYGLTYNSECRPGSKKKKKRGRGRSGLCCRAPGPKAHLVCYSRRPPLHHRSVTSAGSVSDLATAAATAFGGAPIVFVGANAGVAQGGLAGRGPESSVGALSSVGASDADWDITMQVNVLGVVRTLRACLSRIFEQDRLVQVHVVATASVAGIMSSSLGPYTASKHACVALCENLHQDLVVAGRDGQIKVHVLCPGLVYTDIVSPAPIALSSTAGTLTADDRRKIARRTFQELMRDFYRDHGLTADQLAAGAFEQIEQDRFFLVVEATGEGHLGATRLAAERGRRIGEGGYAEIPKSSPMLVYIMQRYRDRRRAALDQAVASRAGSSSKL